MKGYAELVSGISAELTTALQSVNPAEVDKLREAIAAAPRVFVAGKGRSGLQMRAFAMRLMHAELTVYVVDDVTTPAVNAGDLLVIGSGSGETPSLVSYATRVKALNAKLALITTAPDSPLGQQADVVVQITAASPKLAGVRPSMQPMANLFEQALLVLLDVVTIQLMQERNLTSEQMFTRHANLE
jgi:6-phospho-3-hexuloisomerase